MSKTTGEKDQADAAKLPLGLRSPGSMGTLTLDVEKYQGFLDEADLTEDEKREVIERLWQVVTCFVDLGFGVHPLQQACGQDENSAPEIFAESSDVVGSRISITEKEFSGAAAPPAPKERVT